MLKKTALIVISTLLVGIVVLVLAGLATDGFLYDLRPVEMGPEDSGREAMEAAARSHGGVERWMALDRVSVTLEGGWGNSLVRARMAPFLSDTPRMRMSFKPDEHGVTVIQVLDEDKRRFEVRGGESIEHTDEGEVPGPEEVVLFANAIRHLIEMPFAMLTTDVQRSVSDMDWEGGRHTRTFTTWVTPEPQTDVDQYILWRSQTTGLLERFETTARFSGPMFSAQVELSGHKELGGFLMPSLMQVENTTLNDPILVMKWRVVGMNFPSRASSAEVRP